MTDVANNYGQAIYALAREESLSDMILEQLTALSKSFAEEPAFVQLLCTTSIPKQERCQILDDSLRTQVHPYVLNFLKILTEKGYMREFAGCCRVFRQQYNQDNGILPVIAVTRLSMSDELRRKLTDKLSSVTGKTIELESRVDPECLGGIRLDLGNIQLDGTIRHRLDELHGILKNTVL